MKGRDRERGAQGLDDDQPWHLFLLGGNLGGGGLRTCQHRGNDKIIKGTNLLGDSLLDGSDLLGGSSLLGGRRFQVFLYEESIIEEVAEIFLPMVRSPATRLLPRRFSLSATYKLKFASHACALPLTRRFP